MGQEPTVTCPHCKSENSNADAFCKECGELLNIKAATTEIEEEDLEAEVEDSPNGTKKVVIISIGVLAVFAAIIGFGYYYLFTKSHDEAKAYMQESVSDFDLVISDLNTLSTEKNLSKPDIEVEKSIETLSSETSAVEKLQHDITRARENQGKRSVPKEVSPIDTLLRQFYSDTQDTSEGYKQYLDYKLKSATEMSRYMQETQKLRSNMRSFISADQVVIIFLQLKENVNTARSSLQALDPPTGLEEIHSKRIGMLTDFDNSLSKVIEAIKQGNISKIYESIDGLVSYLEDSKTVKEINDLEQYYYEEMHKKFLSLGARADMIQDEFVISRCSLKADIKEVKIEAW